MVVALRDRVHTLKEMAEKAKVWYQPLLQSDIDTAAQAKQFTAAVREPFTLFIAKLQALPEWRLDAVHQAFADTLADLGLGMGKLGPAIRVAITGTACVIASSTRSVCLSWCKHRPVGELPRHHGLSDRVRLCGGDQRAPWR